MMAFSVRLMREGISKAILREGLRLIVSESRINAIPSYNGKRPSLSGEKPTVPKKMMGTLTVSISNSVHTSISPIFLYKLYSVATP